MEELRLFHTGETHDPLVRQYFTILQHSDGRIFINKTLKQIGVRRGTWINLGGISNSSNQKRLRHLDRIQSMRFTF